MRAQPPTLLILLEPVGKTRPVREESLVGHLDGRGVDGDQSCCRQRIDGASGRLIVGRLQVGAAAAH